MLCFNICFIHGYKIARVLSHSLIRYWMSNMASDAKACFSFKVEYRAVIRYLYLKGKTAKELHGQLADVYGSSALSYAQVKFWVGEFKRSRTSTEDEARSGRPLYATDEEMCKKVRDLIYSDREFMWKKKPGLDAHWMPPTKKCVRKFGIWHTLIGNSCGRNSAGIRHFTW